MSRLSPPSGEHSGSFSESDYSDSEESDSYQMAKPLPESRAGSNNAPNSEGSLVTLMKDLIATSEASNGLLARIASQGETSLSLNSQTTPADDGTRVRAVKFILEASLNELSVDPNPKLVLRGNVAKMFGSNEVAVLGVQLVTAENRFPVSLSLDMDHLNGKKIKTFPTVNGSLVMLDVGRKATVDCSTAPKTVYESTETPLALDFRTKFPQFPDAESLNKGRTEIKGLTDLGEPEFVMYPLGHPVLAQIDKSRACKNAEALTPDAANPMHVTVTTKEANRAQNAVIDLIGSSNETTPVGDIYLSVARSNLSQATLETADSTATSMWLDSAEIGSSLKDGQKWEKELGRDYTMVVSAIIKYRPVQ